MNKQLKMLKKEIDSLNEEVVEKYKNDRDGKYIGELYKYFSGIRGSLNIKFLFQEGNIRRYRCNWHDENGLIAHSEYVHISENDGKIIINPKTHKTMKLFGD